MGMSALVQELQKDALDPTVRVSDLLRKASVVAFKLNLRDSTQWIEDELKGYPNKAPEEVPDYRRLKGEVKGFNPYRGWQPVIFENTETHELVSERSAQQSVGELDDLLASSKGETTFHMEYPHSVKKTLVEGMGIQTDVVLFVSRSSIAGILDRVRNAVLEWSLQLEKEGILGEGMSFSDDEKKKASAQGTVYNIGNFAGTIGDVSGNAQVSIKQENTVNVKKVADLLGQIQRYSPDVDFAPAERARLETEVAQLQEEVSAERPSDSRIRKALSSLKNIFEGASGNVVAQGVLSAIQSII